MAACIGATEERRIGQFGSPRPRMGRWGPLLGSVALILTLMGVAAPVTRAEQVLLLIESRASIYQHAAVGVQKGLTGFADTERVYLSGNRLQEDLRALRISPPDLVVAIGTKAARLARNRLPDVPILYCLALRPAENSLVGKNIGGVVLEVEVSEQLDRIRAALPHLRHIGVVHNDLTSGPLVQQARGYLGDEVQLIDRVARNQDEAARHIHDLLSTDLTKDDAFWLLWDPVVANPATFRRLVELSLRYKVPIIAPAREFAEAGALLSVGPDYLKAGEQTARLARQVLAGETEVAEIRERRPRDIVIITNGEVARRLGIDFPADLPRENLLPLRVARNKRTP